MSNWVIVVFLVFFAGQVDVSLTLPSNILVGKWKYMFDTLYD